MGFVERGRMHSNLERFIDSTAPIVPSHTLPKREIGNLNQLWHPYWEKKTIEYFTLGDLWRCFDEWSAYGAGVPITLNNGETVVQYYVPYLSAIQIFTSNASIPNFREDGDSETSRDLFSDSCSDESESSGPIQDFGSNQNDILGDLYFHYNERSAPYGRVPLVDKINELARGFPKLMTLKSVELSPASWMAVAWYPIYHIPTRIRTVKSLSACFLTFHTLSSSFQDMGPHEEDEEEEIEMETIEKTKGGVALSPFGLATYKMQGSEWVSSDNGEDDHERLLSLVSAADSWLKQLSVQHHDFTYFTGIQHV